MTYSITESKKSYDKMKKMKLHFSIVKSFLKNNLLLWNMIRPKPKLKLYENYQFFTQVAHLLMCKHIGRKCNGMSLIFEHWKQPAVVSTTCLLNLFFKRYLYITMIINIVAVRIFFLKLKNPNVCVQGLIKIVCKNLCHSSDAFWCGKH